MTSGESTGGLMRQRGEDGQRVTSIELFFDLVFVFAVTQLARLLLDHLSALGAAQTLLLLLAVWRAWIDMVWITNWFDPNRSPVRLLLLGVMLLSLIMSAALPEAFGARGLAFAGAFVAIQVAKPSFAVTALGSQPQLRRNFQRILVWCLASGVLWLAGGLAAGTARETLWLAAVLLDYAAPASGFITPGLGRSNTGDWTIAGAHMSERCQLFLIIALGESILDSGVSFSTLSWSAARVAALGVAFVGTVALWWIYFYRSAEGGSRVIASSTDPGRLGRSAYTYFHLPMVAGIIVTAVGDELTIAHPTGASSAATTAVILGGAALFLAGHALFKRALSGRIYLSRLVGIAALGVLTPFGTIMSPLLLAAGATLILVAVAGWETWVVWRADRSKDEGEEAAEAAASAVGP
jgi:low temperature requirement protein LtrA